jgi:hypothetical protein
MLQHVWLAHLGRVTRCGLSFVKYYTFGRRFTSTVIGRQNVVNLNRGFPVAGYAW